MKKETLENLGLAAALAVVLDAGKSQEELRRGRKVEGIFSLIMGGLMFLCPPLGMFLFTILFALAIPVVLFRVARAFLGFDD